MYAPLVDPEDMDQHDVEDSWFKENLRKREFLVLEFEGEVAGVLTLQDTGEHLYLGYVYLHVDFTGRGLGKVLLHRAWDEAQRRGKRGMVLIAHPDATWAVKAYERYGFQCIAADREHVLAWNDGWLAPYYEEGFHLFAYELHDGLPN